MQSSIIVTKVSFVHEYLRGVVKDGLTKIYHESVGKKGIDGQYNIVFVDFSQRSTISRQAIEKFKENSNVLISLTPSNDPLVYREFPFYLFDFNMEYPFAANDIMTKISTQPIEYQKTAQVVNLLQRKQFDKVIQTIDGSPDNEEELVCVYHSLAETDRISEAEEIKESFYRSNLIPIHPKIKALQNMIYDANTETLIQRLKSNAKYFCSNIEEQLVFKYLGIDINNENKRLIQGVLPLTSVFYYEVDKLVDDIANKIEKIKKINDVGDLEKPLVISFFINRNFEILEKMSQLTKVITIILTLLLNDINAIRSITKSTLTFSPIINTILYHFLNKKKSNTNQRLNFDSIQAHSDFLKGYKSLPFLRYKESILNSVYVIGLRDTHGQISTAVYKLAEHYSERDVIELYDKARGIKKT